MKLWLISQTYNNGYDTYDSAVVAAETEEDARETHPSADFWDGENWCYLRHNGDKVLSYHSGWADPLHVQVEYLGETDRDLKGAVLASFNAG